MSEEKPIPIPRAAESESGYAASLRQQAAWIREALDAQSNPLQRIGMEDIDTDELDATAAYIGTLEARAVLTPEQAWVIKAARAWARYHNFNVMSEKGVELFSAVVALDRATDGDGG